MTLRTGTEFGKIVSSQRGNEQWMVDGGDDGDRRMT
jgi:hypothetical protein